MSDPSQKSIVAGCLVAAAIVVLTVLGGGFVRMMYPRVLLIHIIPVMMVGFALAVAVFIWSIVRRSGK